jgi:hypothetical protein
MCGKAKPRIAAQRQDWIGIPAPGNQVRTEGTQSMNEVLPTAPSLVDLDRLAGELQQPVPAEVAKFAPATKYRSPTTLGQTLSDLRRVVGDMQRATDEHALKMKAFMDEVLRILN